MYDGYLETLQKRFLTEFEQIEAGYNFDFGVEFEIALCRALLNMLPNQYGVCRGYVVASDGTRQGDDILIYEQASHPTISARDTSALLRKEKVPVEAVYSYIEAKHTVFLSNGHRQSLEKAVEQVSAVKSVVSSREARQFSEIVAGFNFKGVVEISAPIGFPEIRNPSHGVIFARNVKMEPGSENLTDDEIFEILDGGKVQINAAQDQKPDIMILGSGIVVLPVSLGADGGYKYNSPFASTSQKNYAIARCPNKAFGVGLSALVQAVDWITLGKMPWSKVATAGIDNFQ